MIDVYLREYARLECERLELDLGQPCEDEDQRLKGCYRNLGKRKFDRFITLYQRVSLRRNVKLLPSVLNCLRGRESISSNFFPHSFAICLRFADPDAAHGQKDRDEVQVSSRENSYEPA